MPGSAPVLTLSATLHWLTPEWIERQALTMAELRKQVDLYRKCLRTIDGRCD